MESTTTRRLEPAPEGGAEVEEKVIPLEKDESESFVYYDMTESHKLVQMIGERPG